jgi:hypothetical protein
MQKTWMSGPFLDISHYTESVPKQITIYPELFEQLFNEQNRYSAFYDYFVFYHSSALTYTDAQAILENFTQCQCCEQWFDRDDLVDTEQMIGGGAGLQCEDCVSTLG